MQISKNENVNKFYQQNVALIKTTQLPQCFYVHIRKMQHTFFIECTNCRVCCCCTLPTALQLLTLATKYCLFVYVYIYNFTRKRNHKTQSARLPQRRDQQRNVEFSESETLNATNCTSCTNKTCEHTNRRTRIK